MARKVEKIKNSIVLGIRDMRSKGDTTDNEIRELLKLLSRHKDFELIKYSITIELIINEDLNYNDKTKDFVERISLLLFDDKSVIKKIEDDYKKVSDRIYGKSFSSYLESAATLISKIPINLVKKAVSTAVVFGANLGYTHLKRRSQVKKLSTLSPGDFAKRLIFSAMTLLFASNHFESEAEYKNYFKNKLKEINLERKFIMKELFEDHYDIEDNQSKVELLHNFDNYLIDQMNLYNKKRGR